ncbi:uncharacterized protein METZ01_LOCUS375864 [marine metagenome]|uniref:Uncharacterized protein n=1 Tax=marine metagenome TaxID=408172 RepID=A0A382TLS3_9ZZZZ
MRAPITKISDIDKTTFHGSHDNNSCWMISNGREEIAPRIHIDRSMPTPYPRWREASRLGQLEAEAVKPIMGIQRTRTGEGG